MSKRKREDEDTYTKRFKVMDICRKRKVEQDVQVSNKRYRSMEQYIEQMEYDNKMMKDACSKAGEIIQDQRRQLSEQNNRIAELETLLKLQRTQMDRIIVNNNITVY